MDAGVVIPGINDDFVGAAPDIGAFEYRGRVRVYLPLVLGGAPGGMNGDIRPLR